MQQIRHLNPDKYPFGFNQPRSTVVIDVPTKDQLKILFSEAKSDLDLNIGVAFVHPHDNYNKKSGVASAVAKKQMISTCLGKITIEGNETLFHFSCKVPDNRPGRKATWVEFSLSYKYNGDKVKLRDWMFE